MQRTLSIAAASAAGLAAGWVLATQAEPAAAPAKLDQLAWLAGAWVQDDGRARVEEHWIEPAGGLMLGCGRTIRDGKATAFEFLRIEQRQDGEVFYVAHPGARSPDTEFRLTSVRDGAWTFENPAHDFPRLIRYTREKGGGLSAHLEGLERGQAAHLDVHYARPAR